MACDICGRVGGELIQVREEFRTPEVAHICRDCEAVVSKHLGRLRTATHNGNYNLVTVWADVGELADRAEANARLIAAAPDLLALAKRYASECAWCSGTGAIEHVPFDNGVPSTSECIQCADIRAVIEKAEGRE